MANSRAPRVIPDANAAHPGPLFTPHHIEHNPDRGARAAKGGRELLRIMHLVRVLLETSHRVCWHAMPWMPEDLHATALTVTGEIDRGLVELQAAIDSVELATSAADADAGSKGGAA